MALRIYNTLARKLEDFSPINKTLVGIYCCGPTTYNYAHIGNLRAYIFNDILRRTLVFNGIRVKHVMNITDVGHLTSDADEGEDKMIAGARREGKTVWEVAKFYENAFFNDTARLNILKPDVVCRATEHIKEMVELVKKIEKNGYTYNAGGNVYFDVSKFKNYAELARLNLDEAKKSRVEADKLKKNPADFVLWFTKSKFSNQEMKWDSPWGEGYPGWHIECSAMSMKYLGEQFDIHCGGIDHIPVHHTNEIAQSEAATGKHPCVKYWMHNEFLVVDKGKMAKSGEGFITLQTIIDKGYDPLVYRYLCLGAQYRQQLKFSYEGLDGAKATLNRLREKVLELKEKLAQEEETEYEKEKTEGYIDEFTNALNDDLNTPGALSVLWSVLRDDELIVPEKLDIIYKFDEVFGLGLKELARDKVEATESVMKLVALREEARKNKDWKESDRLRDEIKNAGFVVKDTPEGQKLSKA
jgi:cysteinyl-tRNA synthetase